jgi:restriction endonuclease Mrr
MTELFDGLLRTRIGTPTTTLIPTLMGTQATRVPGEPGRWPIALFRPHPTHTSPRSPFTTTSRFTDDATDHVTRVQARVVLIDGRRLADLMIEYGVGVSQFKSYELKRVDEDYFVDDEGAGPFEMPGAVGQPV